jgi:hypothetical protein
MAHFHTETRRSKRQTTLPAHLKDFVLERYHESADTEKFHHRRC